MTTLRANSFSLGLAGVTEAESSFTANTRSTGIDGGEGDDLVDNRGNISVTATTFSDVAASAISIFGTAGAGDTSDAKTEATGISGGKGNDGILG